MDTWISIYQQNQNNPIHSPIKLTCIQFFEKPNEKVVFSNLQDKRQKRKPKYKLGDLVRTSDNRSVFSKGHSTNYSYEKYTKTEVTHDNNSLTCNQLFLGDTTRL